MQYVGKLMRKLTPEQVAPSSRAGRAAQRLGQRKMSLQVAEQWRDRLIAEEAALSIWLEHFPAPTRNSCAR
jgi:ribosome-associated protein